MIKLGNKAPAFRLPSHGEGEVSLKDLAGRWVVLYFYPRDNTPGCTTEALDFQAAKSKLARQDAIVLGVSKDSLASHEKFASQKGLKFDLLSDPEAKVIDKYGAWGEKKLYGKTSMGIIRTTVIIDPDGRVAKIYPKVRVKGHVDEVLADLKALRKASSK